MLNYFINIIILPTLSQDSLMQSYFNSVFQLCIPCGIFYAEFMQFDYVLLGQQNYLLLRSASTGSFVVPHPWVTGQNGSGQNGTDKMVWTKWYTGKMVWDKMVWTKWYGQNGSNFWNRL